MMGVWQLPKRLGSHVMFNKTQLSSSASHSQDLSIMMSPKQYYLHIGFLQRELGCISYLFVAAVYSDTDTEYVQ